MSLGLTTDLHPKNHAARSTVLALLAITLLILLTSCRDASDSNVSASPDTPASNSVKPPNLDPAKVNIRPFGSLDRIASRFPAGSGIIHYLGASDVTAKIPSVFSREIKPEDKITYLGSERNYYFGKSLNSQYPDGIAFYHHPSSTLYTYGKVKFTEAVQQVYHSYLKQAPCYSHISATLYKISLKSNAPLIWPTPGQNAEVLQSFDLNTRLQKEAMTTWGHSAGASHFRVSTSADPEHPWTVDTHLDLHLADEDCRLTTDMTLNLNHDFTIELKRTEDYHLLLTLNPSLRLSDGYQLENRYTPDSPEQYLTLSPSSDEGYTLKSYWVHPDLLALFTPQDDNNESEEETNDPFAVEDPPTEPTDNPSGIGFDGLQDFVHRVQSPELGNFFSTEDAVYDVSPLFEHYDIPFTGNSYVLYNKSKQHLHLFADKNTHDLFDKLLSNIRYSPPSHLISSIAITAENTSNQGPRTSVLETTTPHTSGTPLKAQNGKATVTLESTMNEDGVSMDLIHSSLSTDAIKATQTGSSIYEMGKPHRQLLYQDGDTKYYLNITTKRIYINQSEDYPRQIVELTRTKKVAEIVAPVPVLFTRAYRLSYGIIYPYYYEDDESFAENDSPGSIKDRPRVKAPDIIGISSHSDICMDVKGLLEKWGVVFQEGGWCLFNRTRATIIAHTDATNHDIIRQLVSDLVPLRPIMLKYTFLRVSIPKQDTGTPLGANEILSNDSIQFHYSATTLMRSGEKSTFTTAAPDSSETCSIEIEGTLGEDGETIDTRVVMKSESLRTNYYHVYRRQEPQVLKAPTQNDPNRTHYIITRADIIRP